MNYGLEVAKIVAKLQSPHTEINERIELHNRLREIRFLVTKSQYGVPDDRVDDVMQLEDIMNDPLTPEIHVIKARETIKKIVNESPLIKSMRKSLVKEMRKGRSDNVRDITDYVNKHKHLQNG